MSIREIARRAGVSPAAVSYALRGPSPKVSPAVRAKIEKTAADMGYQRDWQAAMVMRRFRAASRENASGLLSVIHPAGNIDTLPSDSSVHKILPAIKAKARSLNYGIDVLLADETTANGARLRQIMHARGVQGVLVLNARRHLDRLPFDNRGFHTVAIGYSVTQPLHRVCPDQYDDMFQLLTQLQALGYKRPGLLMYRDLDQRTHYRFTAAFLAFYRSAMGKSRAPIFLGAPDAIRFQAWLKQARPDVLIFEEQTFFPDWLVAQAKKVRLRVPDDLGLASIDVNQRVKGRALAGITQDWAQLGSRAVEMLVSRIYHGPPSEQALTVDSVEMVRSSWVPGWSVRKR